MRKYDLRVLRQCDELMNTSTSIQRMTSTTEREAVGNSQMPRRPSGVYLPSHSSAQLHRQSQADKSQKSMQLRATQHFMAQKQVQRHPLPQSASTQNRTVIQKMSNTEQKICDVIGAEENGKGWEIAQDIDQWVTEAGRNEELAADEIDISQQTLIETVIKDEGYNDANASRLITKNPYSKGDIAGKTKVKEGPTQSIDGGHQVTKKLESFDEDDLGVDNITHQLFFRMLYANVDEGAATQDYIARNPLLADFNTSDVVEEQVMLLKNASWAREEESGTTVMEAAFTWNNILISDLINQQFLTWWDSGEPSIKSNYEEGGELSAEHRDYFLQNIPNGKLAFRNAQAAKKTVEKIEVEKEDGDDRPKWSFTLRLAAQEEED